MEEGTDCAGGGEFDEEDKMARIEKELENCGLLPWSSKWRYSTGDCVELTAEDGFEIDDEFIDVAGKEENIFCALYRLLRCERALSIMHSVPNTSRFNHLFLADICYLSQETC